jgi:hypothetical protein
MGYAQDSGYTPTDITTIMNSIMLNINAQFGTTYTTDSFLGTNFYKYFYALAQKYQENEIKTSEIFLNLQGYFDQTNAKIDRPVTTAPGIVERLLNAGWVASVKPMISADAGKISICVDAPEGDHATGNATITSYANLVSGTADTIVVGATTFTAQAGAVTLGGATFQAATSNNATAASLAAQINAHATAGALVSAKALGAVVYITTLLGGTSGNSIVLAYHDNGTSTVGATVSGATLTGGTANPAYAAAKLAINTLISQITAAGCVTQGTQSTNIVLSNGQSFTFKFYLPTRIQVWLRLTNTLSENNEVLVGSPDDVKAKLLANIQARYRLGRDFEPQRYYSATDAPWVSQTLLEWTSDVTNGVLDPSPTWHSTVYMAAFNELFDYSLARITLVEN